MKFINYPVRLVVSVLEPMFWRKVLLGQTRVCVYLTSGQKVKFNLAVAEFTLGKDNAKYDFGGLMQSIHFRPTDIVAWREVRWF